MIGLLAPSGAFKTAPGRYPTNPTHPTTYSFETQRRDTKTQEGHKDTGGTQRNRRDTGTQRHRDIKTQEHKDTGGTQSHKRDTKTQEGHRHRRERLPTDISGGLKGN